LRGGAAGDDDARRAAIDLPRGRRGGGPQRRRRALPSLHAGRAAGRGAPAGITGVVLLAESHLAVHTWPEIEAATLDVYVCNLGADNSARAEALLSTLIAAFEPASVERHAIERGSEPATTAR
jgi:hypothetical protein